MKQHRIHAEHLLGRIVRDTNGRKVGRIEEIEVETNSKGAYVTAFVVGAAGLLERMSLKGFAPLFLPSLVKRSEKNACRIPWDKMDLSNPRKPRSRCPREEL